MKKIVFLCPHCHKDCSIGDITCPKCGRIVRNASSTGTRQKLSPMSWLGLLLIVAVIAVFAIVIYLGVHRGVIATG